MIMEPFEVYRYYLALRLHFTTDKYDVIQQQGKVRASKQAFFKRKDLLAIRRVAESYSDKDVVNFLVSNFISGDRWGGVFDTEAKERYTQWKKRIESLSYVFEAEVRKLNNAAEISLCDFKDIFTTKKYQHPYILKAYLGHEVSIETLVILNQLTNFVDDLDEKLSDDIFWPDISRIIKKYAPFLRINKEKYDRLLRRSIGSD